MSSATFDHLDSPDGENTIHYRAVHAGAIFGIALLLFTGIATVITASVSPDFSMPVSMLNLGPLAVCLWSLAKIRRDPTTYTGRPLAMLGSAAAALLLAAGVGHGAYLRATEVPADHSRISFIDMRPDSVQERSGVVVPPEVLALDGKKVFIKGYMRPPDVKSGISQFLLVRDNNQCCFGDISTVKYYDRILVDLTGANRLNYSDQLFAIGGVLRVMPQNINFGPEAPVFALQADHAK